MFNESVIKAYNRTRRREYFFKEEMLYLNEEMVSYQNNRRKDVISRSLENLTNQQYLRKRLKKHSLLSFIDYWELIGFFDYEIDTKIDLEELVYLSKGWLKNFSAIVDLAILLAEKNTELKNPLYVDENDFILHQLRNPEYYSNKDSLTIDSIVKTSCFQQSTLITATSKRLRSSELKEAEIVSMQIELQYLLKKNKMRVEEEKHELFADILYQLAVKSQHSAIEKANNVMVTTEKDYEIVQNLTRSLNKTLRYLQDNDLLLKIVIINELKR